MQGFRTAALENPMLSGFTLQGPGPVIGLGVFDPHSFHWPPSCRGLDRYPAPDRRNTGVLAKISGLSDWELKGLDVEIMVR
jgi:hypothetical protein